MRNILYKIYIFIIVTVFIINLLSIFNFSFFGFRIFRVGSGSMEPNLKVNDIVIIRKVDDYKVNDIVTYNNNNEEYITHRIIRVNDDEVVTKGDSNNKEDNPIKRKNIIGKLVFKITGLGFITYLFSKPISWVLLFIIGLTITIFIPDKKRK